MSDHLNGAVGEAAPVRPRLGLDELIAPVTAETFFDEYRDRRPLILHRTDPAYYSSILTLADVDRVLSSSGLGDNELRVVKDGNEAMLSQLVDETVEGKANRLEALYAQYRGGATINLVFLHERWPALAQVCQSLASRLSANLHGNVYLTPAGAQALTPHHDPHDVFVLQLYGTKHWRLHPTQTELPLHSQHYELPEEGAGDPVTEFVLAPGDFAYLPRGTVHSATANEKASLHLTIGITPMVWAHVLRDAVEQVVTNDVAFRTALPAGFIEYEDARKDAVTTLATLVTKLAGKMVAGDAVERSAGVMSRRRQPDLAGHLVDLETLPSIELHTPVRIRPDLFWRFAKDDEELHLDFHGKTIDLPEYVEDELAFMSKADEFTGAEVPGSLDDAGRLVLVRRLLQEGFLTTS